jgi:hypothetical protein
MPKYTHASSGGGLEEPIPPSLLATNIWNVALKCLRQHLAFSCRLEGNGFADKYFQKQNATCKNALIQPVVCKALLATGW